MEGLLKTSKEYAGVIIINHVFIWEFWKFMKIAEY